MVKKKVIKRKKKPPVYYGKTEYKYKIKQSNAFIKKYIKVKKCPKCTATTWCSQHGYIKVDASGLFNS
jgi:hypothetical protein